MAKMSAPMLMGTRQRPSDNRRGGNPAGSSAALPRTNTSATASERRVWSVGPRHESADETRQRLTGYNVRDLDKHNRG